MSTTRRPIETSFWDKLKIEEGWFSFFSLLLALMTVMWSIEGANWVNPGSFLIPRAALVGFFIGFGLAKIRFVPSLLAHSFVLSVGMVFIGLLVAPFSDIQYADWSRRLGSTVLRVVKWTEATIAGNSRDDNLVYLVMLTFGVWLLGYSAAWTLFRGHKVWWALALLGTVLMVNLSFNPPRAVFSFTFFMVVALLLVVRFSAFMDEQRWQAMRMYFQPGLWRGAMVTGACLVLVITAIAFATPSSSQIDTFGQVLEKVSQPFNGVKGIWDNVGTGGSGNDKLIPRSAANYNSLDDSFTIGGSLKLSNEPVLRVSGEANTDLTYLQGKVMDQYDGKGWVNTYQSSSEEKPADALFRRLSLAANQSLPTANDKGRSANKLIITPLVPNFTPVLTLGDLVSLDQAALVAFHYEKVFINSTLESFKLKELPDGNGGTRSVLVDNHDHAVPPAALDIIKYLKEGAKLEELFYPGALTVNYIKSSIGPTWTLETGIGGTTISPRSVAADNSGIYKFNTREWSYELPPVEALQALNLQRGGVPQKVALPSLAVLQRNLTSQRAVEIEANVYLNTEGKYVVRLESPWSRDNAARDRFEATDIGKQVVGEIKKLQEAVKGNKVSYGLTNGRPSNLLYEGYEPNYDDLTGAVLAQPVEAGASFVTNARRYRADVQSLRRASTIYPDWIRSRYLKLPANLPTAIKTQAEELTAGITNPYDRAMAIVSYLNTMPYTLDPPAVPAGRDVIEFFLTESKTGYCVHFSSSLALMLRSIGVPTRVVTGFIGGEYDETTSTWIVKGTAAHAWTQVYFPTYGWIDFEPTPGREGIQRPVDPSAVPPLPPTPAPGVGELAPGSDTSNYGSDFLNGRRFKDPEAEAAEIASAAAAAKNNPFWLFVVAGLVLGGIGLYLARRAYLKRQFAVPDPSPFTIYNRMSDSAKRIGLRGRMGMTPYEYSNYLSRQLPAAAAPIQAITQAYVESRYGSSDANAKQAEERRQQNIAQAKAAEAKLQAVEADGKQANPDDLWQVFKTSTVTYQDNRQVREVWENYQEAVLDYQRQKRKESLTPEALRKIRTKTRQA